MLEEVYQLMDLYPSDKAAASGRRIYPHPLPVVCGTAQGREDSRPVPEKLIEKRETERRTRFLFSSLPPPPSLLYLPPSPPPELDG